MTFKPEKAFHAFVALPTVTILLMATTAFAGPVASAPQASETPTEPVS